MMPAPVSVAYALLIALPTIKLIAAVISRRSWRRIRVLQAELDADPTLTDVDREYVRGRVAEAFGHPALMLLPFAIPVAMPIAAVLCTFMDLKPIDAPELDRISQGLVNGMDHADRLMSRLDPAFKPISRWIHIDPRLSELEDLTFPLAFLRYPLSALATIIMLLLTGWMPMIVLGVNYGGKYLFRAIRDVARTNTLSPLFSTRTMFSR